MESLDNNRPRLVPAGQGLSFNTIQYKNRFLYSKYNPTGAILSLIQKTEILPQSIILINSPCLWYGIEELLSKTKECALVAIELDTMLFELASASTPASAKSIPLFGSDQMIQLDTYVRNLVSTGKYRRILTIDFSAGTQFSKESYSSIYNSLFEINERWWKNRITLTRFGRLYSKNIFRNLKNLKTSIQLNELKGTVDAPILVCGAGESIDTTFPVDSTGKCPVAELVNNKFYVIAVDAAVSTLQQRGIKVRAAVLVESQFAITKAFIGTDFSETLLIKDMTSRPDIFVPGKTAFFTSEFTEVNFLKDMKDLKLLTSFIPPLGSVGLTAVEVAKILSSKKNPIYIAGLDFCYSLGKTHAAGTPAHNARLSSVTRLHYLDNIDAAFGTGCFKVDSQSLKESEVSNCSVYTSIALENYCATINSVNAYSQNIFDITNFGLKLCFKKVDFIKISKDIPTQNLCSPLKVSKQTSDTKNIINKFLEQQKNDLLQAKDILINGESSSYRNHSVEIAVQLTQLLETKEYLFLHFPDGYCYRHDIDFLKRVRAEIDFFLKQISQAE